MDYSSIGFLGQMCVVTVAIAIASISPVLTGLIVYGVIVWLDSRRKERESDRR